MSENKVKVAILISGRGSNMSALIAACKNKDYNAEIGVIISNRPDAKGLEIAKANNIKTFIVNHKNFNSRQDFDQKVSEIVKNNHCQIICLAGFMRILSAWFVQEWKGRLINIHPSLLPAFKGADAVGDAIKAGAKKSGCTVHFVEEEVDCGKIIHQQAVNIDSDDDKESLACKILAEEHKIYPKALKLVCEQILKDNKNKNA